MASPLSRSVRLGTDAYRDLLDKLAPRAVVGDWGKLRNGETGL